METLDLEKANKELYSAGKDVQEVVAKGATFLAIEDVGEPGGAAFQAAIEKLYGLAFTTKFMLKGEGIADFKVSKLEALWLVEDPKSIPQAEWRWRLLIRIPESVKEAHLKEARRALQERKGLETSAVKRIEWEEGRAIQTLHVGPYDKLHETYQRLHGYALEGAYQVRQPGHEIYISDPRRTAPEKLKTIVRMPIRG